MTSGTDLGRTIERVETFVVSHTLNPRTGPSIALSSAHAYVLVKVTDSDGVVGWGETYLVPGIVAILEEVAPVVIGRSATGIRGLSRDIWWSAEHTYAASALTIAVEDLRARQLGLSVAESFGGPVRDRVRLYAAFGGYVEGVHPKDTWFGDVERVLAAGFTAMKFRVGRYPIAEEAPLLEKIRADLPDGVLLMADGNAGYTLPRAIEMGRILGALGFTWFEEPLRQRDGYSGYEHLRAALDIALAGGEILQSRSAAVELLGRRAVDVVQPEPVICGGIADTLWIADLAATHTIPAMPHTSNNALGIAAGLQVLACLPDPTRSPASDELFLEVGVDDNPHRAGLLATPMPFKDGWATVPSGPGLGVEIDEAYLAHHAVSHTVIDAAGGSAGLTESEAALIAALSAIARLPGASVTVEPDATWVASGRPLEGLNHVLRAEFEGDDAAIEARIDELDAALRANGAVPTTWWLGPSTTPVDLERRLEARGFADADPEYGMVLDLRGWPESSAATSASYAPTAAGEVVPVEDAASLDDFLAVMAGAYGWTDDGRNDAWAELYHLPVTGEGPALHHVIVRDGGRPAACASVFIADGHAFVTNVGTIPAARGRGLGTRATLAVLDIAARHGSPKATLTASRMGRGVYARIGFREDALLRRRISPG